MADNISFVETFLILAGNNGSINVTDYFFTNVSSAEVDTWMALICAMYAVIWLTGLAGNGLVVYVVLRYDKMRRVPFYVNFFSYCYIIFYEEDIVKLFLQYNIVDLL